MRTPPPPTHAPSRQSRLVLRPALSPALSLILGLAGCAVGPDFQKPAVPGTAPGYTRESAAAPSPTLNEEQATDPQAEVSGRWWTLFGSEKLDALVERALRTNPTIESADAALRGAQENVAAQRGFFFPTVQAQYSPSRQRNAVGTIAPTLTSGAPVYTLYTAQLAISYSPDVFGLNRRQVESLEAQELSTRAELQAAAVTLETNVVAAVLQRAILEAEIAATNQIIAEERDALKRLTRQLETGYAGRLDVAAQEAILANAEAGLPPLERQLEQTLDLLGALIENDPSHPIPDIALEELSLPDKLPLSLPSRLVEQRPDVQAALGQLHAAVAGVGVATADLLPQFPISAAYGGASTRMSDLFRPDNVFWSIVDNATATLFDGGTLLARRRAAQAGADQALATYKLTVVQALQNVADTLYALETDGRAMKAALRAESAAKVSLDLTKRQVDTGYANYLALIAAQANYQQAVLARLQARGTWFGDTASLFQALGGGWWRPDAPDLSKTGAAGDSTAKSSG